MKTYKTWEAIKMLTENPKLKFKGYVYSQGEKTERPIEIYVDQMNGIVLPCSMLFRTDEEWTLIEEPVDFMTAAKAFNEGNTVKCIFPHYTKPNIQIETILKQGSAKGSMREEDNLTFHMVVNGTWYIEDGEVNE